LKQLSEDWHEEEQYSKAQENDNNVVDSSKKDVQVKGSVHMNLNVSVPSIPADFSSRPSVVLMRNEDVATPIVDVVDTDRAGISTPINTLDDIQAAPAEDGGGGSRHHQLLRGPRIIKRTTSCPPVRGRSATSGPWSLEWIKNQNIFVNGGYFPSNKNVTINSSSTVEPHVNKKKGAGYLRHTAQNMRRIARLPVKDREDVLCALKRNVKKRMKPCGDTQT